MILDGWGKSPDPKVSAIESARTPYMDSLLRDYPDADLLTDGVSVGLPEGQMGNSEVGHMNLGAGRIVYQDLAKINLAVQNNTLKDEPELNKAIDYALKNNKKIHLLGLVSDGGVHAHINHLKGLVKVIHNAGVSKTFVHAFTDGRDVDPKSGKALLMDLENELTNNGASIASVIGRYYAMDRDKRWERVKKAYDLLIHGTGTPSQNIAASIQSSYDNGITDEFIDPIVRVDENNQPIATIEEDDVVLFFNFRTDRGRELTEVLSQSDLTEFGMKKRSLYFVTMTNYNDAYKGIKVMYDKENIQQTLGEVLSEAGKTQI